MYSDYGLSPCGESGLKLAAENWPSAHGGSLPMRGEWIEIILLRRCRIIGSGLSPCGESGLKLPGRGARADSPRVSPHAGRVD